MYFSRKKVSKDLIESFYKVPIPSVQAFALMVAPVYIFLPANEKLLCIKAPLDFFLPEEMLRLAPYEFFYFPKIVDFILPFREAGMDVRETLLAPDGDWTSQIALDQTPFAIADRILGIVGRLWWPAGDDFGVEPFHIAVFANEVCGLLPQDKLVAAREEDIEVLDYAVLTSGWAVFLALHLGFCDLKFLCKLREQVFEEGVLSRSSSRSSNGTNLNSDEVLDEVSELIGLSQELVRFANLKTIKTEMFLMRNLKISQKLRSRFVRVEKEFLATDSELPSIFGERGFIDA